MSYEIVLSPAAEEQFVKFPPQVQQFLEDKFNCLGENPYDALRSYGTFLGLATLYCVEETAYDGQKHTFYIPFRFSQDETSIEILAIAADTPYR